MSVEDDFTFNPECLERCSMPGLFLCSLEGIDEDLDLLRNQSTALDSHILEETGKAIGTAARYRDRFLSTIRRVGELAQLDREETAAYLQQIEEADADEFEDISIRVLEEVEQRLSERVTSEIFRAAEDKSLSRAEVLREVDRQNGIDESHKHSKQEIAEKLRQERLEASERRARIYTELGIPIEYDEEGLVKSFKDAVAKIDDIANVLGNRRRLVFDSLQACENCPGPRKKLKLLGLKGVEVACPVTDIEMLY